MDNINLNNIKGKKVLVVGMGRSGIAALQAMLKLGADVTVQDAKKADEMDGQLLSFLTGKGLKLCLGSVPDDICDFDMMILSPGVDPELDFICRAREAGVEITGELEIAYRICRGRFVAIVIQIVIMIGHNLTPLFLIFMTGAPGPVLPGPFFSLRLLV